MNNLPQRKNIRLEGYDYSRNGAYFVTICAQDRAHLFGHIVGADDPVRPQIMEKSEIGHIVSNCWNEVNYIYENVETDAFCVMPNHIHGIIIIRDAGGQGRPPLQKVLQGFKSVTMRMCFPMGYQKIWQRSYHDRIIRSEAEHQKIRQYITANPSTWHSDKYYIPPKQQ